MKKNTPLWNIRKKSVFKHGLFPDKNNVMSVMPQENYIYKEVFCGK